MKNVYATPEIYAYLDQLKRFLNFFVSMFFCRPAVFKLEAWDFAREVRGHGSIDILKIIKKFEKNRVLT